MAATDIPSGCIIHNVPFGQCCFTCMTAVWNPSLSFTVPAPQGWQCPVCQHVMSPSVAVCMFCPAKTETFITKNTVGGETGGGEAGP